MPSSKFHIFKALYQILNCRELLLSFVITFIQFNMTRGISKCLCSSINFTTCFIFSCFLHSLYNKGFCLYLDLSPEPCVLPFSDSRICSHSWRKINNMKWFFTKTSFRVDVGRNRLCLVLQPENITIPNP